MDAVDFSPKTKKPNRSSNGRKSGKSCEEQLSKFPTEQQRRQIKERAFVQKIVEHIAEAKHWISIAQDLPLASEKAQSFKKTSVKVHKNSQSFHLHTEERAAQRAGFNYLVASKISFFEILRRFELKILKVIEDEDIKLMRKEMVPKAQLMPIFDKPFLPQSRSTRASTVPREHIVGLNRIRSVILAKIGRPSDDLFYSARLSKVKDDNSLLIYLFHPMYSYRQKGSLLEVLEMFTNK